MDGRTRNNLIRSCYQDFVKYRLNSALDILVTIVHYCENSEVKTQAESLRENYRCMISFLSQGAKPDNKAFEVQKDAVRQGLQIMEVSNRDIRISANEDTYSRKYNELLKKYGSIEDSIIKKWNLLPSPDERIQVQDEIFYLLWTDGLWTSSQMAKWYDFLTLQPETVTRHLLGGVFLSLWEFFDAEKITLLKEMSDSASKHIAITASTYLILILDKYKDYPTLKEEESYMKNLRKYVYDVQKGIMLMHWTKEVSLKEEEELAKLNENDNFSDIEKYVTSKMEFTRFMMSKNLDINLSSRAALYPSCKFLREISHWFLPFDKSIPFIHEVIVDEKGNTNKTIDLLADNIIDCDTDKYALFQILGNSKNRTNLLGQLNEELLTGISSIDNVNPYAIIRNLYRFFVHSPQRAEFLNLFASKIGLGKNQDLMSLLDNNQKFELCKIYKETGENENALAILNEIMNLSGADMEILTLTAECEMAEANFKNALYHLKQAELLDDEDVQIKTKMIKCLQELNMTDEIISQLKRLIEMYPEEVSYYHELIDVLLQEKKYNEVHEVLFLLDYRKPDDTEVIKKIVLSSLRLKDYSTATRYNSKLAGCESLLTQGHIHFLQDNWKEALDSYKDYIRAMKESGKYLDEITIEMFSGFSVLRELGKDEKEIQIMQDILLATSFS